MIYFTETSKKTPVSQYYQGHEEPGQALKLVTFGPPPLSKQQKVTHTILSPMKKWREEGETNLPEPPPPSPHYPGSQRYNPDSPPLFIKPTCQMRAFFCSRLSLI